jgi:YVTN family beta-propeller protein
MRGRADPDTVSVIDTTHNRVSATIRIPGGPLWAASAA